MADWREDLDWNYLDPKSFKDHQSWLAAEVELTQILSQLATLNLKQLEWVKTHVDFRLRNF